MSVDSISDRATLIRNAITIKNPLVTLPYTKNNEIIAKILAKEGYIHCICVTTMNTPNLNTGLPKNTTSDTEQFTTISTSSEKVKSGMKKKVIILALKYVGREKKTMIHAIKRVSKPSLRLYSQNPIPPSLGGLGIFIVSTSYGIITDKEAREKKLGGEILLEIW
uniref:ribosomal protein S8 n=1 Tax=Cephaleuros karstenii TaxID=1985640 RepID=UPI001EDDB73E|nr:ribosomal protein S8 [Cephaleuros karstenii]UIB39120.1 ribosomal protein S8 [Cephaleuros karstenii]